MSSWQPGNASDGRKEASVGPVCWGRPARAQNQTLQLPYQGLKMERSWRDPDSKLVPGFSGHSVFSLWVPCLGILPKISLHHWNQFARQKQKQSQALNPSQLIAPGRCLYFNPGSGGGVGILNQFVEVYIRKSILKCKCFVPKYEQTTQKLKYQKQIPNSHRHSLHSWVWPW